MQTERRQRLTAAGVAVASTVLEKFSVAVFLPALPLMGAALGASVDPSRHSVATYMIGAALSQLLWGYVSDFWGRRRVLLILTPIYVAGCLTTGLSTNMQSALLGLFLQGFGIGAMFSITQALVGASFGKAETTKALAYVALAVSWAAAVGALIGGWLLHVAPWQSVFVFLAAFALAVGPLYLLVPREPVRDKPQETWLKNIGGDYLTLLGKRDYLQYVLTVALHNAVLYAFYTIAPFLIIDDLDMSPGHFSTLLLIPLTGFMLGRLICAQLNDRLARNTIIMVGNATAVLGALSMVVWLTVGGLGAMTLMAPMALYLIGMGITAPAARAGAIHTTALLIGTASSLLSVAIHLFCAGGSFVAAQLAHGAFPLYALIVSLANLVLFAVLKRRRAH